MKFIAILFAIVAAVVLVTEGSPTLMPCPSKPFPTPGGSRVPIPCQPAQSTPAV